MKLGERKYTQDEGPAQEPWTEAPGKSPRAADGKTGAQDAPRRRGVRGTDAGESACETPEAPEKHKFRLFTGDRVLWIIVAALAVISVLVVYSSTAKMAYDAHTARTTAHFLRQQLIILVVSLIILVAVQKINCRIYNLLARPAYFLSVALTVAVLRDVLAQAWGQLHHGGREGAHRCDERVGPGRGAQHHGLAGGAGGDQRAMSHGGIGVGHHPSLGAQRLHLRREGLGAGAAAGGNPHLAHAEAVDEGLGVRQALHPCAYDEQRPLWHRRQPLGGQQRRCGGAPCGDRGAIQDQPALASGDVKHHHVALDRRAPGARVAWGQGDELGHGHRLIRGGHHKQAAALCQRQHGPPAHPAHA